VFIANCMALLLMDDRCATNAVRYEIALEELQAMTEDVSLFLHVPRSFYVQVCTKEYEFNRSELDSLRCIKQYPLNKHVSRDARTVGGEEEEESFLLLVEKRLTDLGFRVGTHHTWN
jgi:hypothetical protein